VEVSCCERASFEVCGGSGGLEFGRFLAFLPEAGQYQSIAFKNMFNVGIYHSSSLGIFTKTTDNASRPTSD